MVGVLHGRRTVLLPPTAPHAVPVVQVCTWKYKTKSLITMYSYSYETMTIAEAYGGPHGCADGLLPNATDSMCYGCNDGLVLKSDPAKGYAGCMDPDFECPSTFSALCYGSWGASAPMAGIAGYASAGSAVCTNQITATVLTNSVTTTTCPTPCVLVKVLGFSSTSQQCVGLLKSGKACAFVRTTTQTKTTVYTPTSCPTTSPWPVWGWKYACAAASPPRAVWQE